MRGNKTPQPWFHQASSAREVASLPGSEPPRFQLDLRCGCQALPAFRLLGGGALQQVCGVGARRLDQWSMASPLISGTAGSRSATADTTARNNVRIVGDPGPTCVSRLQDTAVTAWQEGTAMMLRHLSLDQRRALALMAGADMNGVTETMMLARGFTLAMIGVLVRKRLVIVRWKPVRVGGKMIEVGRFMITDTGRRTLEGR
jgi:hypothetical protein